MRHFFNVHQDDPDSDDIYAYLCDKYFQQLTVKPYDITVNGERIFQARYKLVDVSREELIELKLTFPSIDIET